MPPAVREKIWNFPQRTPDIENSLVKSLQISTVTAAVLTARGVTNQEQAINILGSQREILHDPFLIPDMEPAIDRIQKAILRQERVLIYGDYDVDGITSTSLYVEFFRSHGLEVHYQLPNRFRDGYGFTVDTIKRLHESGISLLITADCGTTARDEIAFAGSCGIDVIITDHHEPGDDPVPEALGIVNPCRIDSSYPFRGLCSGALVFKVGMAYDKKYADSNDVNIQDRHGLDLVALATIADMAPLLDENRVLVREGLKQLSIKERVGIKALKDVAKVTGVCRAETIGFALAPRINAAGRMDDPAIGVRLLTTDSSSEAKTIASKMDKLNQERKHTQHEMELEADGILLASYDGIGPVVISALGWHIGIIGIVAARIAERYYRPAVVIAVDGDGIGRGSARSIPEFDLFRGISQCRTYLDAFGGHQFAAGLTIQQENIQGFREEFTSIFNDAMNGVNPMPHINVDAEVDLEKISFAVVDELSSLGPFGAKNPEPILASTDVSVYSSQRVGNGHLRIKFRTRNGYFYDAIGFGMSALLEDGTIGNGNVDAAFRVSRNLWQGKEQLRMQLVDVRRRL